MIKKIHNMMVERRQVSLFVLFVCCASNFHSVEAFVPTNRQPSLKIEQISNISPNEFAHQRYRSFGVSSTPSTDGPTSSIQEEGEDKSSETLDEKKRLPFYKVPRAAYRIYKNYAKRLWRETDVEQRQKIADDKIRLTIRAMQHVLQSNEYASQLPAKSEKAKDNLMEACYDMEKAMEPEAPDETISAAMAEASSETTTVVSPKKEKKQRSVLFGALMGATVACWVFSGNYVFTGIFTLMTILGQLEYYRMVMNTGVYPARRISVVGACSMFLTVSI